MAKRYVSNEQETPRLFPNEMMEKLSHVHPIVPIVLFAPLISYFLFFKNNVEILGIGSLIGLLAGGLLSWTLAEYLIHRFVFHYHPVSEMGKKVHFLVHGIHHDYPRDPMRLVMPPVVSIPLAITFYGLFSLTLGNTYTPPFYAGFVLGYLAYDMIHYGTHHFSMKQTKAGLWLKHYHSLHHYKDEKLGFGVSNPLWDFVFRTALAESSKPTKA